MFFGILTVFLKTIFFLTKLLILIIPTLIAVAFFDFHREKNIG